MKKLLFLVLGCLYLLSSCVSKSDYTYQKMMREEAEDKLREKTEDLDKAEDKLSKKTEELDKAETRSHKLEEKVCFFLRKLTYEIEINNKYEEALEILKDFRKEFPDISPYYYDGEIRDLEEKIKEKKEKDEHLKKPAEKRLTKQYDEIENITWYYDTYQPSLSNYIYMYIGQIKNEKWLRFKIKYSANDWLFINKYTFKIDSAIETISVSYDEVKRDASSGYIYETIDLSVTDRIYEIAKKIANSKRTLLRYHGKDGIFDREITEDEKKSLRTILDAFKKL